MPLASTWKHKLPSSSHNVAVTLGFMPGGAIWPLVSYPGYWLCMPCCDPTPGSGNTLGPPMGADTGAPVGGDVRPLAYP